MANVAYGHLQAYQPQQPSTSSQPQAGLTFAVNPGPVRQDAAGNVELTLEQQRSFFFGPRRIPAWVDPYAMKAEENKVLPDAWDKRSRFLEGVIIQRIKSGQKFYMSELLPWKDYDGLGPSFTIKKLIYDPHLLDQVPEEGVVRLVTQRSQEWTATLERFGLGFHMEGGFAMTPNGIRDYAMSLMQIRNATWMTLALGVCYALLNVTPYADSYWRQFDVPYPIRTLENLFEFECRLWGILSKGGQNGFLLMQQIGREVMENRDVEPDTMILPFNTKTYYRLNRDDETSYSRWGAKGPARLESADGPIGAQAEFKIFETKKFTIAADEPPFDPFVRNRWTGRKFEHRHRNVRGAKSDKALNIHVLDMDRDTIVELSFEESLAMTGLWDADGNPTPEIGRPFFANFTKKTFEDNFGRNPVPGAPASAGAFGHQAHALRAGDIGKSFHADKDGSLAFMAQPVNRTRFVALLNKYAADDDASGNALAGCMILVAQGDDDPSAGINALKGALDTVEAKLALTGNDKKEYLRKLTWATDHDTALKALKGDPNGDLRPNGDFKRNDMKDYVDVLLFNPYIGERMGSGVIMKRGSETGHTYIGMPNFMLGHDASRKMLLGNFTCYAGPVIENPRNVYVLHNIVGKGYIGGGGTRYWNPLNPDHVQAHRSGKTNVASLFAIAIPHWEDLGNRANRLDITGTWPQDLAEEADDDPNNPRLHYSTAPIYRSIWGWTHPTEYLPTSYFTPFPGYNTLVSQDTQYLAAVNGEGEIIHPMARVLHGCGPWGHVIYNGVVADRHGMGAHGYVKEECMLKATPMTVFV